MIEPLEDADEFHEIQKNNDVLKVIYIAISTICVLLYHSRKETKKYDEPSQSMDVGSDGSVPYEWSDMQVKDDYTAMTKKSLPSSGLGGGIKRKSKTSTIDQDIRDCIFLMADSVTEAANAIKSSRTSPREIRNMYTELMLELTNIPGFSEEEVDTIYDNLSKNPTLILSFLSKPIDSKVRWMRKELGI